ncbi:MAG: hypothetical protein K0S00_3615 [Xanthobacteraceae bacterium]|jgi:hypothetical protein|nr:hypothetical protein [Xanthobacteraceae bacterium]
MDTTNTPPALIPPLRLRVGSGLVDIATLDEALRFAEENPHPKGDYEGMVRRLQGAHETEDLIEAGNAFRWWAESNALVVEPGLPE